MTRFRTGRMGACVLATMLAAAAPIQAAPISVTLVGTWSTAPDAPNNGQLAQGGKFVIQASYDTTNITTLPAGESDRTSNGIDPTRYFRAQLDGSNFQLFLPLQGGGGVVETQTGADHFPIGSAFAPKAEIQFFDSNGAQFRGLEFESQFLTKTQGPPGGLVVEMFTADANLAGTTVTNSTAQILQCADDGCGSSSIVIRSNTVDVLSESSDPSGGQNNPGVFLSAANPVVAAAGTPIIFDASHLTRTTDAGTALVIDVVAPIVPGAVRSAPSSFDALTRQADNDLGAGRTDGQDFLTYQWTVNGGTLNGSLDGTRPNRIVQDGPNGPFFVNSGTRTVDNVNVAVSILNSGLQKTTDTTSWGLKVTEDFTNLSGSDTVGVSYKDALPQIVNASATAQGPGGLDLLFDLQVSDADLAVNALIPGFEHLAYQILVDGVDQTAFFAALIGSETGGQQLVSNADLISQFGLGPHTMTIRVSDWAIVEGCDGCSLRTRLVDFDVLQGPTTVPEPPSLALLALALAGIGAVARRRTVAA